MHRLPVPSEPLFCTSTSPALTSSVPVQSALFAGSSKRPSPSLVIVLPPAASAVCNGERTSANVYIQALVGGNFDGEKNVLRG